MAVYTEKQRARWEQQAPDGWELHDGFIERGYKVLQRIIPIGGEGSFVEALLFYPLPDAFTDYHHYATLSVKTCRPFVGDFYSTGVWRWIRIERPERKTYKRLCEIAATITDSLILEEANKQG